MVSRAWRAVALACALLALSGCAGVPSSGPVRTVRRVPAEAPEVPEGRSFRRRLPPNPPAQASPVEIVNGFLLAQPSYDGDHAIARKYLAPGVTWNATAPITVYASPRFGAAVVRGDTATVTASLDVVGTISADGDFRPPVRRPGPTTFRLRRVAGEWRLMTAPAGVLISRQELGDVVQRFTLYFPNAARRLVPYHVFLRNSDQPAASTVVRALLEGPRGWIAPAVRSAIPDGTELLDPPSVDEQVVTLNFSREIRRAPQETVGALIAQIVWSLTELPLEVQAVRIRVEGDPLAAPGRGDLSEHRRSDWPEYDPVAPPADTRLFFVRGGLPFGLDGTGLATRVAAVEGVESFAVNRTGTHVAAVVAAEGGRRALVVAEANGATPPQRVLTADRLTAPTWEPGSDVVWTGVTNGGVTQVSAVPLSGPVAAVAASLPDGTLEALRLSPDGSRLALLVKRPGARGVPVTGIWMLRVQRSSTGERLATDARPVAPSVSEITAMAFDGASQLVVAGTYAGVRTLVRLDVDGFSLGTMRVQGLPSAAVTALASSAATPPDRVAVVGNRMWRRSPGADWAALPGTGAAVTFAG